MPGSYQLVRVFAKGKETLGNLAAVVVNESNIEQSFQRVSDNLYKQKSIATTCFISQKDDNHYDVKCFNGDTEIKCCGHGMIAAAKTIFSDYSLTSIVINEDITASYNIDEAGCDVVILNLPRLSARIHAVPAWVSHLITNGEKKLLPNIAAVSENSNGYLLLEFEPALASEIFRAMQLDLKQVCDNTMRAIVVVQFDQENEHLYMRYFAPQYGVPEDSATGSVMRFVADYIEQRYQSTHFEVSQCSLQGGYMKVDCKAENILISANATNVTAESS